MARITIGAAALEVADVAARGDEIVAATGCDAAETLEQLRRGGHAGHVASALHPLLIEPMPLAELAVAIADTGVSEVRAQVLALYAGEAVAAGEEA